MKHSDQPSSCLGEGDALVEGTWKVTPYMEWSFAAQGKCSENPTMAAVLESLGPWTSLYN